MSDEQNQSVTPPATPPATAATGAAAAPAAAAPAAPATAPATPATADSSAGTQNTVPPQADQTVPFWRFKAVNDELNRVKGEAEQAATAKKTADDKALAAQNRWQELATNREKELGDLQPKLQLADKLTTIMARQLEDEIKLWPESVRKIMPAADSPLMERIEWAERTRPLAQELIEATAKGKGTRFPAQHSGTNQAQTTKEAAQAVLSRSYRRKTTDGKGSG
jgi:hypothetical protein